MCVKITVSHWPTSFLKTLGVTSFSHQPLGQKRKKKVWVKLWTHTVDTRTQSQVWACTWVMWKTIMAHFCSTGWSVTKPPWAEHGQLWFILSLVLLSCYLFIWLKTLNFAFTDIIKYDGTMDGPFCCTPSVLIFFIAIFLCSCIISWWLDNKCRIKHATPTIYSL